MKILIADDSALGRSVLRSILEKYGFTIIEAVNGKEAVEQYQDSTPDLILMDLMMPVMNGYEATQRIKELAGDKFIPIIVLTAISEADSLVKSVECGADDCINKPYNAAVIHAKIIALSRIRELHNTIEKNRYALQEHNRRAEAELNVAEHIYDCVLKQGEKEIPCIKSHIRPVTNFNGDILMVAHTPSGGLHVMLGDFTGHGLSAAIGAIPTSEIFYKMTEKGFSIGDIAVELNDRLKQLLPVNMFCAACLIEIDKKRTVMSAWNGSMPDIIIVDKDGSIIKRIASAHTALGVVSRDKFDRKFDIISLQGDEHVLMCSDGLIDVRNMHSEKFGMQNYIDSIARYDNAAVRLDGIISDLYQFSTDGEINDDISLVDIDIDIDIDTWEVDNVSRVVNRTCLSEWSVSLLFDAVALKEANPVSLLLNLVLGIQAINGHRERIYMVLNELYSNALEHGILKLNSSLKSDTSGFQEYYSMREKRLEDLSDASIEICLSQKNIEGTWCVIMNIKDSGDGFNTESSESDMDCNAGLSGRGMNLVNKICNSVIYNKKGNEVTATYTLMSKTG